jgi:glycosyltransferase involved in cell wall biosynthesis
LESVLTQAPGVEEMQIEVVDDCSPKVDVGAMVEKIAGPRVTTYRNPKNLGLAGCWNECIRRSRGELVHLLHQDDLILSGFYTALARGFDQDERVGAAFCRHVFIDEDGHWQGLSALEMRTAGILPGWLGRISGEQKIQCPSIVVRKSVYERVGEFGTVLPHALDWEMWVRIASNYETYYDPGLFACYRLHSSSVTSRQERSAEALIDTFAALRLFSKHLTGPEAAAARRKYAGRGLQTVRRFLAAGDFEAAHRNLKAIVANCPQPTILRQSARVLLQIVVAKCRGKKQSGKNPPAV